MYYGGYEYGHKVYADRQIGIALLERDRFVAQQAGTTPGTLLTPLVTFNAKGLTINVEAITGEVRVRLLDLDGQPIPGFSANDCQAVAANN